MNWLTVVVGVLVLLASGVSGSLVMLYRARKIHLLEQGYGVTTPYLRHIAGGIGAAVGVVIGAIVVYFLSLNRQGPPIEWIGRFSYVLVSAASGAHLLDLVHTALHLVREEKAWNQQRGPGSHTLGRLRVEALRGLRAQHQHYFDLKSRDDMVLEELVGVLGRSLMQARQSLSRLPFYGYLGTICGILLMAQELSRINEASETFKVLSSMAEGLALAFRTTLVALLAYLPLRKASDYLMQRVEALEDNWIRYRDHEEALPG